MSTLSVTTINTANSTTDLTLKTGNSSGPEIILYANGSASLPVTGGIRTPPQGRLTLTSGTPVLSSSVSGAANVYYTPYIGNQAWLYDGSSSWELVTVDELTIALSGGTTSTMHDVFLDYNGGTPQLQLTAWSNSTSRATALDYQDGMLVKDGATDHLYLGSIYIDGSDQCNMIFGGASAGGTAAQLDVFNYYNRVNVAFSVRDTTAAWTVASGSFDETNNSTGNRATFVLGAPEVTVAAMYHQVFRCGSSESGYVTFGLDSTTTKADEASYATFINPSGGPVQRVTLHTIYNDQPGLGRHYLQALEASSGTIDAYGSTSASMLFNGNIEM